MLLLENRIQYLGFSISSYFFKDYKMSDSGIMTPTKSVTPTIRDVDYSKT